MATLVTFHAHPDDEAIATGGLMAQAASDGHRVVLVVATRGELGEPVPGVLDEGEELWERRVAETHEAAEALGVERVEFLGYRDSGMMDEPSNTHPEAFWQADLDEAATRLAGILAEVGADVFTIYDDHGGYGHPDHIQVHRVGARAAQIAGVEHVYEATMNRDAINAMMEASSEIGEQFDDTGELEASLETDVSESSIDPESFGSPEALITHAVDVSAVIDAKRSAMRAHRSQIAEDSFFLLMPPEVFTMAFGTEYFIRRGASRPTGVPMRTDLFDLSI